MSQSPPAPLMDEHIRNLALSRCVSRQLQSEATDAFPESHRASFDFYAHLVGVVSRGEPGTRKPTSRLLSKTVLAKLFHQLGVTRERFVFHLLKAAREAAAHERTIGDQLTEDERELLLAIDKVERELINELDAIPVAGRITVSADLTVLRQGMRFHNPSIGQPVPLRGAS